MFFNLSMINRYTLWSQAISYLSGDYLPNISQKEEGITKLVKDLAPYDLTKAEKLQIVNLAPTRAVELYVVCFQKQKKASVLCVVFLTTKSLADSGRTRRQIGRPYRRNIRTC